MTTDDVRKELNRIDERTHRKLVHYIQTTVLPGGCCGRMCPVCVFAGVGSGGEDQKGGQAIVMAYHGGKKEGMEGDEAKKKTDVRRNWRGRI